MNLFEIVTLIICGAGFALCLLPSFRGALAELGEQGRWWFAADPHDQPVEMRPSEDANDAPIPHRPPRPRW